MKNFQIISLVIFGLFAVFGLLVFSGTIDIGSDNANTAKGTVTLWGTYSRADIETIIDEFNAVNQTFEVRYAQKDPATFSEDLLEAIASGAGPDMFFLSDDLVFKYENKIYTIPYASYPLANYKSVFAQSGEVFLNEDGILAFPIAIDPLVMYYNRNILDSNNIAIPPNNWEDFTTIITKLTKKDSDGQILQSAVPFGQYINIDSAKDILAMLFMQLGNSIVRPSGSDYASVLNESVPNLPPPESVISFYISFADPAKANYTWNKSFPRSKEYFAADSSAFYFGHAGELRSLINKNPNLNFSIAPVPQIKGSNLKVTSSHTTGIAVTSFSKNINTALTAATLMTNGDFALKFAKATGVAPARRDLLSNTSGDQYAPVIYSSALSARSWLDPSSKDTDNIFRAMIEGAFSNNRSAEDVLEEASGRIELLLRR